MVPEPSVVVSIVLGLIVRPVYTGLEAEAKPESGARATSMPIELTERQQETLDAAGETPPQVIDPRTLAAYVLIPARDYEIVRELLDDERRQRAIRQVALRNAIGRMDEEP